jgi:hypothetical protein
MQHSRGVPESMRTKGHCQVQAAGATVKLVEQLRHETRISMHEHV